MKIFYTDKNHPLFKLVQLVTAFSKKEAEEVQAKEGKLWPGSEIAAEFDSVTLNEVKSISKKIAEGTELLSADPFVSALIDQWIEIADAKIYQ